MTHRSILQIANKPGFWLVPSSDGTSTHEVHGRTGSCDCPDYVWRHSMHRSLCRHGKALKAHLEALAACPACGGRGNFPTQFRFQSGSEPIECVTCMGSGKRADADPRLAAVADQFRAEVRERELLDRFK